MIDSRFKIWFFCRNEIMDLSSTFSLFFEADDLERDYENVWEWMEGYSRKYKVKINISREHDWEMGCYNKPIIIMMDFDDLRASSLQTIEIIAKALFHILFVTIYFGQLTITADDDYEYMECGKFVAH